MNVLMLRGLAREQRHWGAFPAALLRQPGITRTWCLDLPGTGTERDRRSPVTIRGIVGDVRSRFLAGRVDNEPWALVCISLGGMVGLRWCADHPGDFRSLVLVNSSAGNLNTPWQRLRPRALGSLPALVVERDLHERERHVLRLTTNHPHGEDVVEEWARFARESPTSRGALAAQLVAASTFRAPARLEVPLAVLASTRDGFVDVACSRAIALRYRSPLAEHPTAGHDLPLDDPEWTARAVAGAVAG